MIEQFALVNGAAARGDQSGGCYVRLDLPTKELEQDANSVFPRKHLSHKDVEPTQRTFANLHSISHSDFGIDGNDFIFSGRLTQNCQG